MPTLEYGDLPAGNDVDNGGRGSRCRTPHIADVGLQDRQIEDRRTAEAQFGVSLGNESKKRADSANVQDIVGVLDGRPFVASDKFLGARTGYVFTTRDGATGYYSPGQGANASMHFLPSHFFFNWGGTRFVH